MKKILCLIGMLGCVGASAPGRDPWWMWTRMAGTPARDVALAVAADTNPFYRDSFYIVGSVQGSLNGQAHAGGDDAFMLHYEDDGHLLNTWQWGTPDNDAARAVAVDGQGNVYVVGTAGAGMDGQPSRGGMDAFLKKFNADGVAQWTRVFGSVESDHALGVAIEPCGDILVCGETYGNNFEGQPGTAVGGADGFLKWFAPDGSTPVDNQYSITAAPGMDRFAAVCPGPDNSVYVLGEGTTIFGMSGPGNGANLDGFVFRMNCLTRTIAISYAFGADGHDDFPAAITMDSDGRVRVVGTTWGDSFTAPSASPRESDFFALRLNGDLTSPAARIWGSSSADGAHGVCALEGKVFIAGTCRGGFDGQDPHSVASSSDAFMLNYKGAAYRWTRIWGGESDDEANQVAIAPNKGAVLVVGSTLGVVDGGASAGGRDILVSLWRDPDLLWMSALDMGNGWRRSSWLGDFIDVGDGWMWHNEHGWLYHYGVQESNVWFWESEMGWWWSSWTAYPYLYRLMDTTWLWYQQGSGNPRWFATSPGGVWESHPRN